MAKAISKNRQVRFKYVFDKDYNAVYANGAYGGATSRGEITINFYFERAPLPNEQIHSISEDRRLGEIVKVDPPNIASTFVRVVNNGAILNLETAREIVAWLQEKIKLVESLQQNTDAPSAKK